MRRRQFLGVLSGAAAAWPVAARAQQATRLRRIGVLKPVAESDPDGQARVAALLQGLQQRGWVDGRNLRIDYRWAGGDAELTRRYAEELVAMAPDVIVNTGASTLGPLQQMTRTVPIVFVSVPDPVGGKFIASLARPGGNTTGFTNLEYSISGKWLELLGDCAGRQASGGHPGFRGAFRGRPLQRASDGGIVARGGIEHS